VPVDDVAARTGRTAAWVRPATAAGTATAAAALLFAGSARIATTVFVAGVLIGLPHGAVDHVSSAWGRGRTPDVRRAAYTACLYAGGLGVAAAVLFVSRPLGLVLTLTISAYHFGSGDAGRDRPALALALGTLPVLGPLVFWPGRSRGILRDLSPAVARIWDPAAVEIAAGLLVVVSVGAVVDGILRRDVAAVAEVVVLGILVAMVVPLAAFGVYFALWHAPRHLARLTDLRDAAPQIPGRSGLADLFRWGAPTAVAAYALLAVAAWAVPVRLWPAVGLVGLLAVSLPHAAVVDRLPRTAARGRREQSLRP
jgi:Brp/Blh family beta-carotene 15,15'-monooxygenase